MAQIRTDLALECGGLEQGKKVAGAEVHEEELEGFALTEVRITDPAGARALGKPEGSYLTLDLGDYRAMGTDALPRAVAAVGACIERLLPDRSGAALVAGLGNRAVTPDAVGPRCADHVLVTRHLTHADPQNFGSFYPVAALAAGVLGTTGVESGELVQAVCEKIRPGFVIAVDALAARSVRRLCTTIQIADTGISPGSGVGNRRFALNADTLGVPVIAVGVPTVVDGASLARELGGRADGELAETLVTPKDVDTLITELAKLLGYGINAALQRGLSVADMDYFLG